MSKSIVIEGGEELCKFVEKCAFAGPGCRADETKNCDLFRIKVLEEDLKGKEE